MRQDQSQLAVPGIAVSALVFGEFRLQAVAGAPLLLSNRRGTLLIALLCLQADGNLDRETLCRLLWPDRFHAQAKASLRQCLLDLRHQFESEGCGQLLLVTRSAVTLDRRLVHSDLDALDTALEQGDGAAAAAILERCGSLPLLKAVSFNADFDSWLALKRQEVDARLRQAAMQLVSELRASGQSQVSAKLSSAVQARYSAARSLAECTLAVLPFRQIDQVGGDFFLAEGVGDELVSRLGNIEGIVLAGRTSILAVAARGQTLPQMAASLRVTHLIEGEVRRTPELITVRFALIEGATGTELWADRIEGSIEDFFHGRKVIGANVIAAICRALGLTASPAPSRRMTHNREAYALYLQARAMIQKIGVEGAFAKGIAFLEQALAIDPDFAECWTALANAHIMTAAITPSLERVAQSAEAARCAERAIELDPGQGHALSILGIHEWTQFKPARALEMAFEAYARDPNDADVCSRLGSCLLYLGKAREALPYVEAAVDRDPVYGRNYAMLTSAYLSLGEIDKALVAGQRLADLGNPSMWLALAQMAAGDHASAVQTHFDTRFYLGTIIMRPPGMPPMDDAARDAYFAFAARGIFSGEEADRAAYCQMLDGLHAAMPDPYDSSIAFPAIWMGHSDLVMKIYSECIHPANMFGLMNLWIDIGPINRTIRDPGFVDFAQAIGMVEAWERFGWPDLMPADPRAAQARTN